MSDTARRIYAQEAYDYIDGMSDEIKLIAGILGINSGLVAGALVEEADSYYTEILPKYLLNLSLDDRAKSQSDEVLRADYLEVVRLGIIDEKTIPNSYAYYTMRDVGPGNIRIAVAIESVQKYFSEMPGNPLGLNPEYLTNFNLLVNDLASVNGSLLAAAVSALALKEAKEYFDEHVDSKYWTSLPQETRDAIIITAYNNGLPKIEKSRLEILKAFGTYKPAPGGGDSGGLDHENNANVIGGIFGLSNYGGVLSYSLEELGASDVTDKALQDTAEGMAYRYALLNFDPIAIPARDHSAYNVNGSLELSRFTHEYLADRAGSFQAFIN